MSVAFLAFQIVLALVVLLAVAERCRRLLFAAPVSTAFKAALTEAWASGDLDRALSLAKAEPQRWASRVVIECSAAHGDERREQASSILADLRVEAEARLGLIRVSATLASTLGLLGGILSIQRGFSGHGLLALSAGLAQQVALSEALTHMAVGIGTAAFSFAAFGLLRRAARESIAQAAQVAARCGGSEGSSTRAAKGP